MLKLIDLVLGLDVEAGGFANIELNPFCSVEGVIYQITTEELQLLDNHTGYPEVSYVVSAFKVMICDRCTCRKLSLETL